MSGKLGRSFTFDTGAKQGCVHVLSTIPTGVELGDAESEHRNRRYSTDERSPNVPRILILGMSILYTMAAFCGRSMLHREVRRPMMKMKMMTMEG